MTPASVPDTEVLAPPPPKPNSVTDASDGEDDDDDDVQYRVLDLASFRDTLIHRLKQVRSFDELDQTISVFTEFIGNTKSMDRDQDYKEGWKDALEDASNKKPCESCQSRPSNSVQTDTVDLETALRQIFAALGLQSQGAASNATQHSASPPSVPVQSTVPTTIVHHNASSNGTETAKPRKTKITTAPTQTVAAATTTQAPSSHESNQRSNVDVSKLVNDLSSFVDSLNKVVSPHTQSSTAVNNRRPAVHPHWRQSAPPSTVVAPV